jgi:transcriptional/translational regulatory protein YebC/TACO1
MENFIRALEDHDDVERVITNIGNDDGSRAGEASAS